MLSHKHGMCFSVQTFTHVAFRISSFINQMDLFSCQIRTSSSAVNGLIKDLDLGKNIIIKHTDCSLVVKGINHCENSLVKLIQETSGPVKQNQFKGRMYNSIDVLTLVDTLFGGKDFYVFCININFIG